MHFEADAQALLQRHAGQGQKDEDLEKKYVQSSTGCLWEKDRRHLHCIDANMEYIYIYICAVCYLYTRYNIYNIVKQREMVYCI